MKLTLNIEVAWCHEVISYH